MFVYFLARDINVNFKKKFHRQGFFRLPHIIGDRKAIPPIPPIIPVSRSGWYAGVKSGRFPKPVKTLGERIALWRVEDVMNLVDELGLAQGEEK